MIIRHWKIWGICLVILLIYLYYKQDDMVVTWLMPDGDRIYNNDSWIFGKYSSGRVVYVRQCREVVGGWDALAAIWPLSLTLFILSITTGISGGYALRDDENADRYKRELSDLESKYRQDIETADRKYSQAESWEYNSRRRSREADQKEATMKSREKMLYKKELEIEKTVEEKVQSVRKQLQSLQEDHKNRCHKMEGLEKDKIDQKRKNISLEKEILKLQEENLVLLKENQALKKANE